MMLRPILILSMAAYATLTAAQGPDIARDFVLTDKDAIGMLSPRVVCGAQTLRLVWSPDGSMLLAHRVDNAPAEDKIMSFLKGANGASAPPQIDPPRQELVFYSARAQKVRAVVSLGDPENQVQ